MEQKRPGFEKLVTITNADNQKIITIRRGGITDALGGIYEAISILAAFVFVLIFMSTQLTHHEYFPIIFFAIVSILWLIESFKRQIITLHDSLLDTEVRLGTRRLGKIKTYTLTEMQNLRGDVVSKGKGGHAWKIRFEYNGKTIDLCHAHTEEYARFLLHEILNPALGLQNKPSQVETHYESPYFFIIFGLFFGYLGSPDLFFTFAGLAVATYGVFCLLKVKRKQ